MFAADGLELKVADLLRFGVSWLMDDIEANGGPSLKLDGSVVATSPVAGANDDLLTLRTRRRLKALDVAIGGGWIETILMEMLETAIAEDWTAEGVKSYLPRQMDFVQLKRLEALREQWIAEGLPEGCKA